MVAECYWLHAPLWVAIGLPALVCRSAVITWIVRLAKRGRAGTDQPAQGSRKAGAICRPQESRSFWPAALSRPGAVA